MTSDQEATYELVLRGGRVIDPESGTDAVRDVAVDGRRIACVGEVGLHLRGRAAVDVSGLVVCPGFIDLHSHGQGIMEQRLQALDGVTTALELESGVYPVEDAYRRAAASGRPIHYGYSASWAMVRMKHVAGLDALGGFDGFLAHIAAPGWQIPATAGQIAAIVDSLGRDLDAGALGIGVLVGYAPESDPAEYLEVARLAASRGVGTFTHARELVELKPDTRIDGVSEIVRAARETGAHMHYCHINGTSMRHVGRVFEVIEQARREGGTVTAEAYPYGSGMTGIGAAFLAPERLALRGLTPRSLRYAPTGERVADAAHLEHLRRTDPGGLCFIDVLREDVPEDFAWIERAISPAGTAIASDAIPLSWAAGRPSAHTWPPPAGAITHPRTAGTFGRTLRLAREGRLFSLPEAITRCTLVPARVLEDSVPAMTHKARVRAGCDADLVVFDPELVSDQATYTDMARPSTGFEHVLVDGTFIVRGGVLQTAVLPGRPVRAA
jgi:N-acyl-D-aspartate/D-glutamate deacylase